MSLPALRLALFVPPVEAPCMVRSAFCCVAVFLLGSQLQITRAADDAELTQTLIDTLPYLPRGPEKLAALDDGKRAQLLAAMPGLKARAKTLVELADGADYLFAQRPLAMEPKAAALVEKGRAHLKALHARLSAVDDWSVAATEAAVRAEAEATGAKLGDLAQPLRAALTGKTTSPGIFDVLETLGRAESLGRIADQAGA